MGRQDHGGSLYRVAPPNIKWRKFMENQGIVIFQAKDLAKSSLSSGESNVMPVSPESFAQQSNSH